MKVIVLGEEKEMLYAVVNFGTDAVIIKNDTGAEVLQEAIVRATDCREIENGTEEYIQAAAKLDFSEKALPRRLYSFADGGEFVVCFADDYGD